MAATDAAAAEGGPSLTPPQGTGEKAAPVTAVAASAPSAAPRAAIALEGLPVECFLPLPVTPDEKAKDELLKAQRSCFLSAAKIEAEVRRRAGFRPWPDELLFLFAAIPWVLLLAMLVLIFRTPDAKTLFLDDSGKVSSSRVVAVTGGAILLSYLMSFGTLLIWGIGTTGFVPPVSDLGTLVMYSTPLLVPYAANQIKSGIVALRQ